MILRINQLCIAAQLQNKKFGYIREELLCSGASYSEELLSDEPFLIAPLGCRHYRMLNGFSAGHVRGYRHARATSLYTII